MVSRKPWSLEAAARLFITVILTLFVGIFLANLVETFKSEWSREQRDFAEMILMTLFFQCSILFWIGRFLRTNQWSWQESFFAGQGTWRAVALGLLAGAISAKPLVLLQGWLTEFAEKGLHMHLEAQEVVEKLSSPTISVAAKVFLGVTAIVVAPVAEEALFRGVLYPTVKQLGYPRVALWFTSLLFGLSHASLMAFVPLTLFAMILVWLYEISDNLMAPIMAHCALNAVNFFWIIFSGPNGVH
jgi:membrane protease YdiL (CAAX protease family)